MTALPTSFLAGHKPTADEFQAILDLLNLGGLFYGIQGSPQAGVANATWTSINMDGTETVDLESAHSTVTNPSRYTCQTDGYYEVSGVVAWAANATGGRGASVAKNGTRVAGSTNYVQANATGSTATVVGTAVTIVSLVAGDYVEIMGIQNSTGALSTIVQSDNTSSMTVKRRVST